MFSALVRFPQPFFRKAAAPLALVFVAIGLLLPTPSFSQVGPEASIKVISPEEGGRVAIAHGIPAPSAPTTADDVTTALQMTVSNAPTDLDGPYYDWGVNRVQFSTDGQTWQEAAPENYSAGFPDGGSGTNTNLVNVFDNPGYWKVTVRANATY